MRRAAHPPQPPRHLVGNEYLFLPGHRRVVVLDQEIIGKRTGRLLVAPAGDPAGCPFPVDPQDLQDV